MQPPSGGCVLKRLVSCKKSALTKAATFGWLCVETSLCPRSNKRFTRQPPSGGCVLKRPIKALSVSDGKAATFGWLCVETDVADLAQRGTAAATFGWLCVETEHRRCFNCGVDCSHLRVAVC